MLVKDVNWCSIDNWYPKFKKVTFKTIVLPIPNDVLDYLKSDGSLILPRECNDPSEFDDDEDDCNCQPSFPEFNTLIQNSIDQLGGQVFPKLNWSAPRDATWIGMGNSLKCDSLSHIWLLLKSSEFIAHDLTQPYKDCSDVDDARQEINYVLALKRWSKSVNPACEFRCYVKEKQLIAIEQRDATNFYSYISEEHQDIKTDIRSFFHEYIEEKMDSDVPNLVFDVARPSKDCVKLIDFNPYGSTTDTSLFDWEDLESFHVPNDPTQVELRFVETHSGIRASSLRHFSLPQDVVDIACGTDHEKLVDFLQLQSDLQNKTNT